MMTMTHFTLMMLSWGLVMVLLAAPGVAQEKELTKDDMRRFYKEATGGIKILPGQWRPHYAFEQIAWVSPPWAPDDYIWLDFPEAIFTDHGLLFLSHINPHFISEFPHLPKAPWKQEKNGLSFERSLPNGVRFGGSVLQESENKVALHLFIENGMDEPLGSITLQTCAYLQAIKEFAELTQENKLVYAPDTSWIPFEQARTTLEEKGQYKLGWRGGVPVVDWPIMITKSKIENHWVGMSWYTDTISLINNPGHPCMHADPFFPDLQPGERADIHGALIFFEGTLEAFTKALRKDNPALFK